MSTTTTSTELASYPALNHSRQEDLPATALQSQSRPFDIEVDTEPRAGASNVATVAPDGGYGWTVVFACSVVTFWFNGFSGAWGVLQTALLQSPGLVVSTSTISFVGSFALGCVVAFGLLCMRLMSLIGARWSGILGISLLSLGHILSGFTTTNVGGLFVTAGALAGIGTSMLYAMSNAVPVQWFSSRLGTANGLVKVGGGLGSTILCVALQYLIDTVGIAWTFRILGFLTFATGIPAACLIKERIPSNSRTTPFVDFSLFRSVPFTLIFLSGAIATFSLFVPPYFLPLFAHSIGLSASTGAGLVAGFNLCTSVGRFAAGFACDRYGATNMLMLTLFLNAISMLAIWPVSSTLPSLIIFAALNGIANGAFFVTMPTTVAAMVGPGLAAVAMGMAITGWTGGYLMGSPIAGLLIQSAGAEDASMDIKPYRAAIFYAGGIALVAGIFVLIARLRMDGKLLKKL